MLCICMEYFITPINTSFIRTKYNLIHNSYWHFALYTHIVSSSICILLGAFQFSRTLQNGFTNLHRLFGVLYWIAVLCFAAPSALYMAMFANGGFWAKISFTITAILWFVFTLYAIIAIKRNQIVNHQNHMIRSYALTLTAVTLRLLALVLPFVIHLSAKQSYTLIAWLSWIPNLIIAELIIKLNTPTKAV